MTCDFILGCYCCKFCLNRRYPDWNRLLDKKIVFRNGLDVFCAAALLPRVKAFSSAKVTLKIGHDTDMSLEETETQQLFGLIPGDHPVIFMRRGKLLPEFRPFYTIQRDNLLVKVTLTPRSEYLEAKADPFEVLESFDGVRANMFYYIGPICHDNFDEAREIIRCLPAKSSVWVKELIDKGSPYYDRGQLHADFRCNELRSYAADLGHPVFDYLNCVVRANVGLGFHKRGEFVSEPNPWQLKWCEQCRVLSQCDSTMSEEEERGRIDATLRDIGLTLKEKPEHFGHKSYRVLVNQDVNFGDECYIREKTSLKVDVNSPGRKTGTSLSASIIDRWRAYDFYPVDELMDIARESFGIAMGYGVEVEKRIIIS